MFDVVTLDGAERPAVEAAAEGDDPGPAGDAAGELERRLDGLGAGVREEDGVERVGHRVGEQLGEPDDRLDVADRACRPMSLSTWSWIAAVTAGW